VRTGISGLELNDIVVIDTNRLSIINVMIIVV